MRLILRRALYSALLLCFVALIGLGVYWKNYINSPLNVKTNEVLNVPHGSSIYSVAYALESKGILSHPTFFIFFAKSQGKQKHLKAGEYLLEPGITPKQLLTKLVEGKVLLRQFTIVEGWTLKQVYNSLNNNPYLTHTIHTLTPADFSKKIGGNPPNFEGYFYPDTYLFARGVRDTVILKKAFSIMQKHLTKLWQNRAIDLPFKDPYSALIVASLIERETAKPEERTKVAGVIVRRLQKNMLLQIDASVIYGLGSSYRGKLTKEDLKKDTPYNTYLHSGLPPTPIAMPSLAAIFAALHPERGSALYYVAKGDGSHEFTLSLQAHHNAIKKYRVEHLQTYEPPTYPSQEIIPWFNNPSSKQIENLFKNSHSSR